MVLCKNCGHRLSHNIDEKGRVIAGWHHKHGHGKAKKKDGQERAYDPCKCRDPEPEELLAVTQ